MSQQHGDHGNASDMPDRRDGLVYVMPTELDLALKVALATGRPLLLRGEPGSGKSSLAPWVARDKKWRYYEYVVTSQTRARDLLWTFDGVRRLADAQTNRPALRGPGSLRRGDETYIDPGPLWWAFAPKSAALHALTARRSRGPGRESGHVLERINADRSPHHAVVLIDEIDKADPDVPNGLLVPLASNGFIVAETGTHVTVEPAGEPPSSPFARHLIVITTNEERELPQAFLRRCVIARLESPELAEDLVRIAHRHMQSRLGEVTSKDLTLASALAEELAGIRKTAPQDGIRPPSTAEYLDALWACRALDIRVGDDRWKALEGLTLVKPQHLRD